MTHDDGMTRSDDDYEPDPDLNALVHALEDAIGEYVNHEQRYLVADELCYQVAAKLRKGQTVRMPLGEFRPVGATVLFIPSEHCLPREGAQ